MRRLLAAVCVALLGAAPQLAAQATFPSDDSIRAIVRSAVDVKGGIGVVVGLLEADGSRRVISVGGAPYDGRTLFEIGSITKVFTGILLATAVQRGEVRLDQPIAELLPESVKVPSRGGRQITLLNLATHTSGLPRMPSNFAPANPDDPYADYTAERMYEFLSGHELQMDIGEEALYSNIGAAVLGHALALRVGMTYEDLVRTRVLEPLEMRSTMITVPDSLRARLAPGHDGAGNPVGNWNLSPAFAGAGALRSDAEDMLTFLAANIAASQSTEIGRAMRMAATIHPVGSRRGGLFWGINENAFGRTFIAHSGGTRGYTTTAVYDPALRRGVVVLSNTSGGAAMNVTRVGLHLLDPRMPASTRSLERRFTGLAFTLAGLLVLGIVVAWRRGGARMRVVVGVGMVAVVGATAWLGIPYLLGMTGLLLRFDLRPAPMAILIGVITALAVLLGFTRVGLKLATHIPIAVLVGVHAFRLLLELMMHDAYEAGLMPRQMSYSGWNFDMLTGISAVVLAVLIAAGRAGTRQVRAWNVLGALLLLNIIVISVLSTPGPLRVVRIGPPNTWIASSPYVWLPTVMVVFALLGHIVLFRRLRLEEQAARESA